MPTDKDWHFYDDDGTEINPDLVPKPSLCVSCARDDMESEQICCTLTRADQEDEEEFQCFAYLPKGSVSDGDGEDNTISF
jgi:hypothetical protein